MSVHSKLEKFEDNWRTSMGGWSLEGKAVLRGKDIFTELNDKTWMEYLLYAATGKESTKIARLVEATWVICTSFPDPRIWNNRVAALAGTARSSGALGAAGAVAVSEATIYGLKPIKGALDFLLRAEKRLDEGESLESIIRSELKEFRSVYGYGRPLVKGDERIEPMMAFARSIGCGDGKYVKLAFQVDEYLSNSRYKYEINGGALCAALLADEGLSPMDIYHMATFTFTAGAMPCFIDALNQQEGCFFPLRTARLNYTGGETVKHWRV